MSGVADDNRSGGAGARRIGVDFDNTIVCYDQLFHRLALDLELVPADLPASKGAVRDHLRSIGHEETWIHLQGEAYGAQLRHALAFPGVKEFFCACARQRVEVFIISHKTRRPFRGPAYDLHQTARDWLALHGFFDPQRIGLRREQVFLELTKQEKLARIAQLGCTHFIDDLPEFLGESDFPLGTQRILFDPAGLAVGDTRFQRFESWSGIAAALLGQESLRR